MSWTLQLNRHSHKGFLAAWLVYSNADWCSFSRQLGRAVQFGGSGFAPSNPSSVTGHRESAPVFGSVVPEGSVQRVPETPSLWQAQHLNRPPSSVECRLNFSCKNGPLHEEGHNTSFAVGLLVCSPYPLYKSGLSGLVGVTTAPVQQPQIAAYLN